MLIQKKNAEIFDGIESLKSFNGGDFQNILKYIILLLYHKCVDRSKNVKLIGEKTPDYLFHLNDIKNIFPNSKIIIINRDGRDVAVSAWYHSMRISKDWLLKEYNNFDNYAIKFADYWNKCVITSFDYESRNKKNCLILQYETLLHNKKKITAEIFKFLNVNFTECIVSNAVKSTEFNTLKAKTGNNHFRKGIVGDWKNEFSEELNKIFISKSKSAFELCGLNY